MDADPSNRGWFPPGAARQSGEQTTLWDYPALSVWLSWALRAHEDPTPSKVEGPSSGSEDDVVEAMTLRQWTEGRGEDAKRGDGEHHG